METLYSENLGPMRIWIAAYCGCWIVAMSGDGIERERSFADESAAFTCFNDTCEYTATRYNVVRPLPDAPDFIGAIVI